MNSVGINNLNKAYQNQNIKNFGTNPYRKNKERLEQDSFEKKDGLSKKQKVGIAAALIATTAIVVGILVNKHIKAKELKKIPEEFRTIFKELKNETGDNFVNKAYNKLKKYMKLEGIAPEKIGRSGRDKGFRVQGGFNPTKNTIEYSNGFFTKLDRATQFEMLAHELKHAEQTSKIIRSGKIDEYARAWAECNVELAKNDPLNVSFSMAYNNAKNHGVEKEFIENSIQLNKDMILDEMTKSHTNTLKMPQFKEGSPEYLDAEKYIEASRNYEGLGLLGSGSEKYKNNLLEKEAYSFGAKMKKYFRTLMG